MIELKQEVIERYERAILVLQNRLTQMNTALCAEYDRDIIDSMSGRVKTLESMESKLKRKGYSATTSMAFKKLSDIAGVRCICSYVDDVYLVYEKLKEDKTIKVIKVKDFIEKPKKSGYRSLHVILSLTVPEGGHTSRVKVELQIRTIVMNLWAKLDHKRLYKKAEESSLKMKRMLLAGSKLGWGLDCKMVRIRKMSEERNEEAEKED